MFVASSVITKIYKRTLNATIVGWANDTTMASVTKDETITTTIPASGRTYATAPGYLAILSQGSDAATTANNQVYVHILTGTTATQTKVTSTADVVTSGTSGTAPPAVGVACTTTTFGVGNIWYDIGAGAFFYTYWKKVVSTAVATTAGVCGGTGTTVHTIHLGGIYVNSTVYWTTPLAIATTTSANLPSSVMGGGDNWLNSSNIYIVYKDTAASPPTSYYSKTTKATTTTSGGAFSTLVADVVGTASVIEKTFVPIGVWTSNNTYGMAVSNKTATAAAVSPTAWTYMIGNYLNGTTTYTDSGLSYSGTSATALNGWMLTTGYALLGTWTTTTANTPAYTLGTFYGNGTVNATQVTLGTLQGPVSVYEDAKGTMWIGWEDVDTANSNSAYAGYLAKLQGQLNAASGANALTTILAFVALFLASIFAF